MIPHCLLISKSFHGPIFDLMQSPPRSAQVHVPPRNFGKFSGLIISNNFFSLLELLISILLRVFSSKKLLTIAQTPEKKKGALTIYMLPIISG